MRRVNTCIAFVAWLSILPGLALAQTAAGSIAGTVRDTSGAVLPGVTVEASSPALIEKVRSVVTDGAGQYRIVDLRPGTYTVTFTLPGFSTAKREGIELTTGFTAPVSVELRIGSVEETLTVTAESPVVDIQNTQRQVVMTRDVIDTVPTARTYTSLAVLIPGVSMVSSRGTQDVGGTAGINAWQGVAMTIHGGRQNDQNLQIDGMPIHTWSSLYQLGSQLLDGNFQEIAVDVAGNSAESESGGIRLNMIPREGGNTFSGRFFATGSHPNLQASNLSDTLRQQGLRDVNRLKTLWEYNPSVGGPILRDKVWFFISGTHQRNEAYVAGSYVNTNLAAWEYVPDLTRQAVEVQYTYNAAARVNWQVTPRNKIAGYYDFTHLCQCHIGVGGATAIEATRVSRRWGPIRQVSWTAPVTNRLLFEAGGSFAAWVQNFKRQPGTVATQIVDRGLGITFRSFADSGNDAYPTNNVARGSVAYVTGTHALKVGGRVLTGSNHRPVYADGDIGTVTYATVNGVPTAVTYLGNPLYSNAYVRPEIGLYAQDQWTLRRLTMNLGVRYDYFRTSYPDHTVEPTRWVPTVRTAPGQVAIKWHDLSPRLGLAYDLFGNAKTALKLSAGRYIGRDGLNRAQDLNPIRANNTNTRSWTDVNGDRIVQGDPLNPVANGEIGPSTNLRFGQPASSLKYDPDWAFGFGQRPSNWEFSAGVQHQLVPRVSVSAAYFRRVYTNFEVTANQALTPADYDPYCVTTPSDARLPSGGGQQICGLYDLKANKVGQVQQVTTKASNYGEQSEHWNGVDFTMAARLPKLMLQGGLSTGKTTADTCAIATTHPEVVASAPEGATVWLSTGASTPTQFCHVETPFSAATQVKLIGAYTLPWDVQLAGTFQNLPGGATLASATFTSVQIAPSLGRPLAAASTVVVNIVPPATLYRDRVTQFDLRLGKTFTVRGSRLQGMLDLYNLFNSNVVLLQSSVYGATTGATAGAAWLRPQNILGARLIKLGMLLEF